MEYTPSLHFDLGKETPEEIAMLNNTIHQLSVLEQIFCDNSFEYERDVFHETRCMLIKIRDFGRLDKNEDYTVTRKDNLIPDDK